MTYFFIQRLTVRGWWVAILPRLLWRRLRGERRAHRCEVFEGSRVALALARGSARLLGMTVERLRVPLADLRDEQGCSLWWRVFYRDLPALQREITADPIFREAVGRGMPPRLPLYLAKALASINLSDRDALWRALLVMQIAAWRMNSEQPSASDAILFLERRPWGRVLARYAARLGLDAVPIPAPLHPLGRLRRSLSPEFKWWLRDLRVRWLVRGISPALRQVVGPRLGVEYAGHLNLHQPERHSDLFFWQQSALAGQDLVMCFNLPKDPLDEAKWAQLREQGIGAVALTPQAVAPVLASRALHRPRLRGRAEGFRLATSPRTLEAAWVRERSGDYRVLVRSWMDVMAAHGITIYLTWFKYDGTHCAIADALQQLGGVLAVYQRSYEPYPSAHTAVAADCFFGFSQASADMERRCGSIIPYYVITGYLGDHRFPLLREGAARLRETLTRHGARRILAFADENTRADAHWYEGHEVMQRQYAFLLEALLREPWLGLVVKPKVPSTLRRRLGPVAELLTRAEATGRCFVYTAGALHGSDPPAAAALAADVMVHNDLHAATAGAEAALAGVPTVCFAREGWPDSPLSRLGLGRVVFTDWEALWKACVEHWARPGGIPGFGDWSPMLDELDPFRDGRAAERMGTYLLWLLDGFRGGLDRETVMADAAERYAARWGRDKVMQINVTMERPQSLPDPAIVG